MIQKKTMKLNPFKDEQAVSKWKEWHSQYENPMIVGHYILGYDRFCVFQATGHPIHCR